MKTVWKCSRCGLEVHGEIHAGGRCRNTAACTRRAEKTTKTAQMIKAYRQGDFAKALSMASTFKLGMDEVQKIAVQRAHECIQRPDFYRSMGRDPDQLIRRGKDVIEACWPETKTALQESATTEG